VQVHIEHCTAGLEGVQGEEALREDEHLAWRQAIHEELADTPDKR
jgi:hypothetical protein